MPCHVPSSSSPCWNGILRWEAVSAAFAAQGYGLVAISPVEAWGVDIDQHARDADQRQVSEELERGRPVRRRTEVDDLARHLLQRRHQGPREIDILVENLVRSGQVDVLFFHCRFDCFTHKLIPYPRDRLAVDLTQNDIERTDNRDNVGDHRPFNHLGQGLEVNE